MALKPSKTHEHGTPPKIALRVMQIFLRCCSACMNGTLHRPQVWKGPGSLEIPAHCQRPQGSSTVPAVSCKG